MNATRIAANSTNENEAMLIKHIKDDVADVRLFATHAEIEGDVDELMSGPEVNFPLLAALVYDGHRWVVYDGNLLNAARSPREAEVRAVIDAAIANGKVLFGTEPVNFTAPLDPEDAVKYLSNIHTDYLSNSTLPRYKRMMRMS